MSFRRLHDTNHSGWNFVITAVLPYVLIIPLALSSAFGQVKLPEGAMSFLMAVILILGILCAVLALRLLCLLVKPSDVGANQYGDDPIGDPDRKPSKGGAGCFIAALVVVLIFVILGAIMLPALSMARKRARDIFCVNNLKQIGAGMIIYAADNDGLLPMDLNAVQTLLNPNETTCPFGLPYQLLESAKGLNLYELERLHEVPLVVCDCHDGHVYVLLADGSVVEYHSWDDVPSAILERIDDAERD